MTRWQDLYIQMQDRIVSAPPSRSAQNAARIFAQNHKHSVLDLACGIGRDTCHFAANGLSVVGVDIAESALAIANNCESNKQKIHVFVRGDARALPFADESFDGVYSFGLLHEFTDTERERDICTVMGEIERVLMLKGLLVLAVLSGEAKDGLPYVNLFTQEAFDNAMQSFRLLERQRYNDIGCTGSTDYPVWYGVFAKGG